MNRVLLLGYSRIAQKALIPAFKKSSSTELVAICSQSRFDSIPSQFQPYNDYKKAIDESGCDTVYISLYNNAHYDWLKYSLENGKNVIIDKPALLRSDQAKECYQLANNKLIIFEAFPYLHHQQHKFLKSQISNQKTKPYSASVRFGFPALDVNDFRNDSDELGGGCIWDLGPYPVSAGEFYFDSRVEKVYGISQTTDNVSKSAAITIEYKSGQILQAIIGFQLEYQNSLELWGDGFYYSLNRSFTIPTDLINTINYKTHDQIEMLKVDPDDSFLQMLEEYSRKVEEGDFSDNNKKFLDRAIVLETINKSCKLGTQLTVEYYD